MGEFEIPKPTLGQNDLKWYKSTDGRFEMELKVKYAKNLKNKVCVVFK
jgi:hypothetical protein